MQIVKWGKKQRQVKVPVGWVFVKNGQCVQQKDKFFNLHTHAWDNVDNEDIGDLVGPDNICVVIREQRFAAKEHLDLDTHAVRIVE